MGIDDCHGHFLVICLVPAAMFGLLQLSPAEITPSETQLSGAFQEEPAGKSRPKIAARILSIIFGYPSRASFFPNPPSDHTQYAHKTRSPGAPDYPGTPCSVGPRQFGSFLHDGARPF